MKLYPLILGLLLVTSSCNDDDPTAPPITAENTFSCKINGDLFVPEDHGGFPVRQDGISVSQFENNFTQTKNNWQFEFGNGDVDLYIYLTGVTSSGDYKLGLSNGDADFFNEIENLIEMDLTPGDSDIGYISTESSGNIEVLELEKDKRIILTFNTITLTSKHNSNETAVLTEGKLNINLETLFEEE